MVLLRGVSWFSIFFFLPLHDFLFFETAVGGELLMGCEVYIPAEPQNIRGRDGERRVALGNRIGT